MAKDETAQERLMPCPKCGNQPCLLWGGDAWFDTYKYACGTSCCEFRSDAFPKRTYVEAIADWNECVAKFKEASNGED